MFTNKTKRTYTATINMLIDENKVRGENNERNINDLYKEINRLREELKKEIRDRTNMEIVYGVHYVEYPLKSLMNKLLKTLGYEIEYNYKPRDEFFKLKKVGNKK